MAVPSMVNMNFGGFTGNFFRSANAKQAAQNAANNASSPSATTPSATTPTTTPATPNSAAASVTSPKPVTPGNIGKNLPPTVPTLQNLNFNNLNLNNFNNPNLKNIGNMSNLHMPLPLPLQTMMAGTNDPSQQMKTLNQMAPVILNPADAFKALAQVMPFSGAGGGIPSATAAMPPPLPLNALQRNNSCSNLVDLETSLKEKSLKEQLEKQQKKTQIIQTAYWSLRSDYQSVCRALKAAKKTNASKPGQFASAVKSPKNGKVKLNTITEGESSDVQQMKDEWEEKMKEKEAVWSQKQMAKNAELANLRQKNAELLLELKALRKNNQAAVTTLKQKNKEVNKKNNTLEMYIKNMKLSIKKLERENKKLSSNKTMKKDILSELYLSSGRIKQLMGCIKGFGGQIQTLRKRQLNLTASIGRDSEETVRTRMNELYCDVVKAEESYNSIYQTLDMIKSESEGKELEVMKKNKEYITLLEKEKFVQSSHLEEYVKENQKLQLDLRDREMKLRQTQSKFNRIKQRLNRLQNENDNLCDQLNAYEAQGCGPMDPQQMGPGPAYGNMGGPMMPPPNGQFMPNPYFNGGICAQ